MTDPVSKKAFGWLWPALNLPPYQHEETEERYPGTFHLQASPQALDKALVSYSEA